MGSKFGQQTSLLSSRSHREKLILICSAGLFVSLLIVVAIVVNARTSANATQDRLQEQADNGRSALGTVSLLAPDRLVRAGTKLSDVRFKEIFWPRHQVQGDAILDPSEMGDYFARIDLQPGVPVQRANITNQPMSVSLPLTPGMRAVSIEVDATSGLEGHALPGTRVDIVLTFHEEPEFSHMAATLLRLIREPTLRK
ncbi:MAG: hypothetical protein DCC75_05455 [Proteobacteria bacterium]|nr:MAG: hypothetical protein DCC75_05455 [Pseudomonadota bacterium]